MNEIFNKMMSLHRREGADGERNALYEVMQQIVLCGLYRGGFFNEAAFYGDTCLRIFYGLKRYSEDMDFSLLTKNPDFSLEKYFPAIIEEARLLGRDIVITKKNKKNFSRVESAFLKDNTDVYNLTFATDKTLKIKIEVDIDPPLGFKTEQKLLMLPFSFNTRCMVPSDLYAGKMHALVFRQWKNRIKGRDWYDFEWYVRNRIPLDFKHLKERAREFNNIELTKDDFVRMLKERFAKADIRQAKEDVLPFIENVHELDIWSNEYFIQLCDMIVFEG